MPTLPVAADFTGGTVTEDQQKTWIANLVSYLSGLLGTAGTAAAAQAALGAIFGAGVAAKASAYTVVATDRGKLLTCSGTWTLSLTASATLGAGFVVAVANTGTGSITIDPSGSETIDGATTLGIGAGLSAIIVCTGAGWVCAAKPVAAATPGYQHEAGGSIYLASDAERTCASVVSYDAIPVWGDVRALQQISDGVFDSTSGHKDLMFKVDHPGQVTVSFEMACALSGTAYARICKNGEALEEWNQTSGTYATRSKTIDVLVGDVVTIQKRSSTTSTYTTKTRNHRLLVTQPTA
jgi:hypothetical protein